MNGGIVPPRTPAGPDAMINDMVLLRAFEKRSDIARSADTTCFRLFNSSGDGVEGVTVDVYGEYLLVQFYSPGLFRQAGDVVAALERFCSLHMPWILGGVLKDRTKTDAPDPARIRKSALLFGTLPPAVYIVRQCGINVGVDLLGGQHTGIFLDMREARRLLAPHYPRAGALVNLFCYTGIFSVHALACGVKSALNVDLSPGALKRAKANYRLNGLPVDDRDFIGNDSESFMKLMVKKGRKFDLVIYDPPSFSRNGRKVFSVKKDFRRHLDLVSRLSEKGLVMTSTNMHTVSEREYIAFHPETWKNIFLCHESGDFPSVTGHYLKIGLWKVN